MVEDGTWTHETPHAFVISASLLLDLKQKIFKKKKENHPQKSPHPLVYPTLPSQAPAAHPALGTAMTTTGHWKESNGEQAQALVSWIYFCLFVVVGFFHRTLCSRQKLALQSVSTSLARAQPSAPCWARVVGPGPFSCWLDFIAVVLLFFFFLLPVLWVFFLFFFLNISQAFSEGTATGSQLADYRRALGRVGWFPPPASQLTWSRSFSNLFLLQK